ncbi:dihydrolipoyl dehydrogenase [Myxococcota bacterium]|nr:dihydrolipoyl dehydrogenase [Myxococcota bacterium]
MSTRFDLIIIGAGPGGYVAALRAAQLKLNVALVERDAQPGGACLWRGCIPTKCLLELAERRRFSAKKARGLGLGESQDFDWSKVQAFKDRVVKQNAAGVAALLKAAGVVIIQGQGRLTAPGRVEVVHAGEARSLEAPHVILATGAQPASLPGFEVNGEDILDSTSALALSALPARLGIIGGGVIGVEFATVMASFGVKVALFELTPSLTPGVEPELSAALVTALSRLQIKAHLSHAVTGLIREAGGLRLTARGPGEAVYEGVFDKLLIATGRRPQTAGLGLEALGLALDRGFVPADLWGRTPIEGLWAIGDIVAGRPQLAHAASAMGVIAVEAIAGLDPAPLALDEIPAVIFTEPEIATVGLGEAAAMARGGEVRVGRFPFAAVGKARVMGKPEGLTQIVALDGRVVGLHIMGPHASDLIGEGLVALKLGARLEQLAEIIHPHPTLCEGVGEATLDALGRALHR